MGRKGKNYYAVLRGRRPGIYSSWAECNQQVAGFTGNVFKGFSSIVDAEEYFNSFKIDDKPDQGGKERHGLGSGSGKQYVQHGNLVNPVDRKDGNGSNSEGFKFKCLFLDASPSSRVEGVESFHLEQCDREIAEHVDHFQCFTSLYELECLLQRTQSSLNSNSEQHGRTFHFDREAPSALDQLSGGNYFEYDAANDLLNFKSEEDLFAYLGLRTINSKQEVGACRYFHRTYKVEFIGSSRGDPGKAGAGIILRTPDNLTVCKTLVGLGIIPWRLTMLHALIVALQLSLKRGIHHLHVIGKFDAFNTSAAHDQRFTYLVEVAHDLMKKFKYLLVSHVRRAYEAELMHWVDGAVDLPEACQEMDCETH
ncbi:uncharacterized protein [Aristolochia californica]|uniref:uncharacterized protein n=1 Tax=Aristolochia californica TaxID=171875 RepID=UPI0035DB5E6F